MRESFSATFQNVGYVYVIIMSILAFLIYGIDKKKAVNHKWRIPEKTLMILAVMGGSPGALAAMYFFRHKTRKLKFVIGIPVIMMIQLGVFLLAVKM